MDWYNFTKEDWYSFEATSWYGSEVIKTTDHSVITVQVGISSYKSVIDKRIPTESYDKLTLAGIKSEPIDNSVVTESVPDYSLDINKKVINETTKDIILTGDKLEVIKNIMAKIKNNQRTSNIKPGI